MIPKKFAHAYEGSIVDAEGGSHRYQEANKDLQPQKFAKVAGRVLAVGKARVLE